MVFLLVADISGRAICNEWGRWLMVGFIGCPFSFTADGVRVVPSSWMVI